MNALVKLKFTVRNIVKYTEFKRFAGHSKWANIKRIKMQTDHKKSLLTQEILRKMKAAIDLNKNTDPDENVMLSRAIAEAKKCSISSATITTALEKLKNSTENNPTVFISKGPLNIIIIFKLISNHMIYRTKVNNKLKKLGFSRCEIPKPGFLNTQGIILTENLCKINVKNKIIEDAIEVGAEDAEEVNKNDKEFIQFTCLAEDLLKVENKLEQKNYKIIESKIKYSPQTFITLTDEDKIFFQNFCDNFNSLEEVIMLESNIL